MAAKGPLDMDRLRRSVSARATLLALSGLAGIFVLVGVLANQSRVHADDPANDRVLRPLGPDNQQTWPDDSPLRLVGGGETGAGKEALRRDGGGGATDSGQKPEDGPCSCAPSGR